MGDIATDLCQTEPSDCGYGTKEEQNLDEILKEPENCVHLSSKNEKSPPASCRKNNCAQSPTAAASFRPKVYGRNSKSPTDQKPVKLEADIADSDAIRDDLCDETVVDGFAFFAFRSHDDMEVIWEFSAWFAAFLFDNLKTARGVVA